MKSQEIEMLASKMFELREMMKNILSEEDMSEVDGTNNLEMIHENLESLQLSYEDDEFEESLK